MNNKHETQGYEFGQTVSLDASRKELDILREEYSRLETAYEASLNKIEKLLKDKKQLEQSYQGLSLQRGQGRSGW